jgi:hypothetical protein
MAASGLGAEVPEAAAYWMVIFSSFGPCRQIHPISLDP